MTARDKFQVNQRVRYVGTPSGQPSTLTGIVRGFGRSSLSLVRVQLDGHVSVTTYDMDAWAPLETPVEPPAPEATP